MTLKAERKENPLLSSSFLLRQMTISIKKYYYGFEIEAEEERKEKKEKVRLEKGIIEGQAGGR